MTGKEICELISECWASKGINKTWEEIWNYSATGELFNVFFWYEDAKLWKERKCLMENETSSPMKDFLEARMRAIWWLKHKLKYDDKAIAHALSMTEGQVCCIRRSFPNDENKGND